MEAGTGGIVFHEAINAVLAGKHAFVNQLPAHQAMVVKRLPLQ